MRVDRLLGEHGIAKDNRAGRLELERRVEARRAAEASADYSGVRRGWLLGGEEFREKLLELAGERRGAEHYGPERAESEVAKAERIVAEELRRRRWSETDLQHRANGDADKVVMARRLRAETATTMGWIATRLHLGTRSYANYLLSRRPTSASRPK